MGFFDNIFRALGISKPPAAKIVCVGLDNSGKTTLLNTLKSEKAKTNADEIVPTGKWLFVETGNLCKNNDHDGLF